MAVQFIGSEILVNTTTAGNHDPQITALADGRFMVTWSSHEWGGEGWFTDIRGRVFNADGSAAGADFRVNSREIAALVDGRFVVMWQSNEGASGYDIRGRVYNADGSAAGADFLVNTTTAGHQVAPQI